MPTMLDLEAVPAANLIPDHTSACSHAPISAQEFRDSMREIISDLPVPLHWRAHELVELYLELARPCLHEECAGTLLYAGTFLARGGSLTHAAQGLAHACERIADQRPVSSHELVTGKAQKRRKPRRGFRLFGRERSLAAPAVEPRLSS